jgi:pimeloyl-ACP methyl ester carboxylesterase
MPILPVNGIDLYYEITGNGEPLLLIHGHGSSTRDWAYQVDHFAKKYQVITLDMRGFGRSSKPRGPYSIRMFAEDTAAFLQKIESAPAHVMGISMGGMIALELALGFPHRVKSLVLINTYPEMRVETWREMMMVWRRFLVLDLFGVRRMGMLLSKILFIKPEQEELRKTFIEHWAENDRRAYRESLKAIVNWDVESRLGEIRCPVLVVASDEDYLPLEEKRVYTTKFPTGKLVVIEDARHAVTAERPEQLNGIVDEFLTQINEARA